VDVVPYGEQFLTPGVHPDAVLALDQAVMALRQQERSLVTVHRMLNEEAAQLSAGVGRAEALIQRLDQPPFDHDRIEPFGLREVERLALDVHLARIEDALARARQREPIDDDGPAVDVEETVTSPPVPLILEPTSVYRASLSLAETLREEASRAENEAARMAPRLRIQRDAAERARTRRSDLDLEFAQRDLALREDRFERARARMRVLPEELEWTTKRLTRSKMLREEQTKLIEAELDTLRAAEARSDVRVPITDNDATVFTEAALREKRILLARERLTFERQKLLRDLLYFDLATHLNGVMDGHAPPAGVFEPYADILDLKRNEERHTDLATRCDGWRRASNTAENKRPGNPAQRELKAQLVEAYQSLTNLCMRHEWVLGTEDRLGEVARYHLDRLQWSARGVGWYVWRVLLSLAVLIVLITLSRLLRRLTRAVAGTRTARPPDAPKLTGLEGWIERLKSARGAAAMLAYLSVSIFCWLFTIILVSRHVWTIPMSWHDLLGWATATLFTVGDKAVTIWSIAQLLIWWFVGVWLARLIHSFVTQNILGHFAIDRGIRDAIGQVVHYLALFVTVALGLASVGIGLGAMGLLFGVIGIGIGFGLQNIASNFISGFILLFERPIRRGDFVQVGDLVGEVKDISARATTLETRDAITVIVPNSEFVSGKVINWTLGSKERVRAQVKVGVSYDSDLIAGGEAAAAGLFRAPQCVARARPQRAAEDLRREFPRFSGEHLDHRRAQPAAHPGRHQPQGGPGLSGQRGDHSLPPAHDAPRAGGRPCVRPWRIRAAHRGDRTVHLHHDGRFAGARPDPLHGARRCAAGVFAGAAPSRAPPPPMAFRCPRPPCRRW
jgi:small-conductance mechanosensitive channel